ncbi:MAG: glycosyltransferase family 4 protein [Ignavibacteriales bacterium]|nr:glycosyltransferase family 4 protein [Ignavibacteriales bacterium]
MSSSLKSKNFLIALPVLNMGGTEMHTLLLARAILSAGGNVSVCCYHEYNDEVVKWFSEIGVEVCLFKIPRSTTGMSFSELRNVYSALTRQIKKIQPDFIHVQYVAPGLVPIVAAALYSSAVITSAVHTSGAFLYGCKTRLMMNIAVHFCDAFVSVSENVRTFWFGTSTSDKIKTIYNGVDVSEVERIVNGTDQRATRKQFSLTGDPLFAIVGRAGRHKGHDVLFNAFSLLRERYPKGQIVVIGEPVGKEYLENLAAELHIESSIVWLGPRSRQQVIQAVASADCLVIPSRYEGFGLTAIEAMSAGVPVIASNVGGLPEVVHHETTGLLFQSEDHTGLSAEMIRMTEEKDLRTRCIKGGKEIVKEKFSFERFATQWIDLFETVAGRRI